MADLKEQIEKDRAVKAGMQKIIFKQIGSKDKGWEAKDEQTIGYLLTQAAEPESVRLQLILDMEGGGGKRKFSKNDKLAMTMNQARTKIGNMPNFAVNANVIAYGHAEFAQWIANNDDTAITKLLATKTVAELEALNNHLETINQFQESSIGGVAKFFMNAPNSLAQVGDTANGVKDALESAFENVYCQCYYLKDSTRYDHNEFLADVESVLKEKRAEAKGHATATAAAAAAASAPMQEDDL